MIVFDVSLEVVGQAVDPLGEQRNLDLGRTGITGLLAYELITSAFFAVESDIGLTSFPGGATSHAVQIKHALGDDFAAFDLGNGQQLAATCDLDHTAEDGGIPSAQ